MNRGLSMNHNETLISTRPTAPKPTRLSGVNHNETVVAVPPARLSGVNHNETLFR